MTVESDTKFEDKLTSDLENNMRNFANFHPAALESWDSKLGLLWSAFIASRKCMSLNFTGESML